MSQPRLRVVAAALFDALGRVLIAERPAGKHMAGWWEFPGGKVAPGETDAQALVRELREELGVDAQPGAEIMTLTHEYPDRVVDLVLWRASAAGEPRGLDGQQLKWVHPHSLGLEQMLPADQPFIAALQGEIPAEVLAFLDRSGQLNSEQAGIHVLDRAGSARYTKDLRCAPVVCQLGPIVLDDANDSNPYCYITQGIASGMVIHVSHDSEPRIKFATLAGFEEFLVRLRASGEQLWDTDVPSPPHPDQAALGEFLRQLASRPVDGEVEFLACIYLPMLREDPGGILELISRSKSFFIRETLADTIAAARIAGSRDLLVHLKADRHPQVRSAAERALAAWRN